MSKFKYGDKVKIIKGRMKGETAKVIGESNLNMEHIVIVWRNQGRKRTMGFVSHYLVKV